MRPGTCLAVSGKSGAGKTVLLRMIADLDPHDGIVSFEGRERREMPAPAWRRLVTYQPAVTGWWADDVGSHFDRRLPDAEDLGRLGLPADALGWPVSRLSTGEQQRIALLRALANQPKALLLDEPTSGLDPDAVAAVERVLTDCLKQGVAILIVSHDADQVGRLATSVVRIEGGRAVGSDP